MSNFHKNAIITIKAAHQFFKFYLM
jgi:hypothetical protein